MGLGKVDFPSTRLPGTCKGWEWAAQAPCRGSTVGDNDFLVGATTTPFVVNPFGAGDRLDGIILHFFAHFHAVLKGEKPAAFEFAQTGAETTQVIRCPAFVVSASVIKIGRVDEEERRRDVVDVKNVVPVLMLDGRPVKAVAERPYRQQSLRPRWQRLGAGDGETCALSAKAEFVADEPARSPLKLCQAGLLAVVFKVLPAVKHEVEFVEKRIDVEFAATVEAHQVAVDVVDDFRVAGRLGAKQCQPSAKDFAVGDMIGDEREQVFEEASFASGPVYHRASVRDGLDMSFHGVFAI